MIGRSASCTNEVSMAQLPVSGVVPPSVAEATIMTVWPSVASTGIGKALGRLYRIREGFGPVSLGRLALLATIPIGLMLYLSLRLPWAIRRYRLTNRRVSIEIGINPRVVQYVTLDNFDAVDVDVSLAALPEYGRMLTALKGDDLPRFEARFKELAEACARFDQVLVQVQRVRPDVDEHRHRAELQDGVDRGGKASRYANHFIALANRPVAQTR